MNRIEINCDKIKNAKKIIEDAGLTILMNPAHPTIIHVGLDSEPEKVKKVLTALGRTSYQEIREGRRTQRRPTLTPMLAFNAVKLSASRNKKKIAATAIAASAAAAGLAYWLT